jgi:hypothetical protein
MAYSYWSMCRVCVWGIYVPGCCARTRRRPKPDAIARRAPPWTMKRPGIAANASSSKPTSAQGGGVGAKRAKPSGGNLLASIIGDMKKSNGARPATTGAKTITREDTMSREAKALEARKKFERDITARITKEVVENPSLDAFCEFETMEKQWRNVVHEIAADMKLHSESVELESGEKFVIVHKKAGEVEKDVESLKNEVAARERAARATKKGEGLSDIAPTFAGDSIELTTVGTVKRDLRSVEETIADMKREKAARGEA